MLLDLVALESRFKILLGDTPFVSFLPEQLVISRFPSNFREIFLTGFLLTGGNFVESLWGSDICPTRMGIFLHVNLYSCIWSVENILCGGHHVTTAFDVLRDRCLTLTKVRFSGGPRTGKERRIGSVWKMVDFKSSLKSPCISWLCKRTSSLRWSCIPLQNLIKLLTDLFVDLIAWEGGARFLYDNHIAKEPKPMNPGCPAFDDQFWMVCSRSSVDETIVNSAIMLEEWKNEGVLDRVLSNPGFARFFSLLQFSRHFLFHSVLPTKCLEQTKLLIALKKYVSLTWLYLYDPLFSVIIYEK